MKTTATYSLSRHRFPARKRSRNHNLEQQAQAHFKSWKNKALSKGYYTCKLKDIADFWGGYSYKSSELSPSKIAMATIKNFDRNGGFKLDGLKDIKPSNKLKQEQEVSLFDVLVAHTDLTQNAEVIGNAEMLLYKGTANKIIFSMDLVKVTPNEQFPYKYLLAAYLRDPIFKKHCLGYVNGTTVLHMSKKALPEYELILPTDKDELPLMNELMRYIYHKMSHIIAENNQLEQLRDSLLPYLMSGRTIAVI